MAPARGALALALGLALSLAQAAPSGLVQAALAAAPAPLTSASAIVVSPHPAVSEAGRELLRAGGNAVDAAVAAAFALAVAQPQSTGIGGGGFLLIRLADGRAFAIDARETAPAAATPDLYTRPGVPEQASLVGGLAVGTPGLVAGLALAQERFGSRPLAEVMAPAIRLAAEGYEIGAYQANFIEGMRSRAPLARFPETARIHFPPGPVHARTRLVQADLARTLRAIALQGPRAFYEGPVAEAIAKAVQEAGGILSAQDLAGYRPVLREPLAGRFRGFDVLAFPPPSSGGVTLLETLNVLEGFELARLGAGSSAAIHRIAEALKLAFADRAVYLGDPDFAALPVARLLDPAYAARLRARINPPRWKRAPWTWGRDEVAIRVTGPGLPPADAGTAHLSVADASGNAVAITETINTPWGSWVTAPGTGVLLNDEMDDFATRPGQPNAFGLVAVAGANGVAAGKRPLSSMSPVIVLEHGRLRFVAGSNGGPRIITSTLLALLNHLEFGMDVAEAVAAPRFHHQWLPDELLLEAGNPADVVDALRARGHTVRLVDDLGGGVEAIAFDPQTGVLSAAPDPRRDGAAAAPFGDAR
jgi:gamma-glutamyltranspeptidase/glutathione hydrolase